MTGIQRRYTNRPSHPIQLRDGVNGAPPTIWGYASVFYREGDPTTEFEICPAGSWCGQVVERIMPGAFARAIAEDDVRALFDHDSAMVLGRAKAGTLRLSVDGTGLRYEIDPPDTQVARDLVQSLRRGDITGSSFAFIPRKSEYRDITQDGKLVQTIIERYDVELFDVGPVTYPAYSGATSGVRSGGDVEAVRREISKRRGGRALAELEMFLFACDDED